MRYPHRLRLYRPGEGGEYDDGAWVPAPDVELYNGPADVQDSGREVRRSTDNAPAVHSDADAFLPDRAAVGPIRTGDLAEIWWEDGSRSTARVLKHVRLDGRVQLAYVGESS